MEQAHAARHQFLAFLILTTLVALVFAFVWLFTPLGLGFQDGPANPAMRNFALAIFAVAYFVGIPALLAGQVLSAILWSYGRARAAYLVPLFTIGSFLLCASAALLIFFNL
jgi:Na+-driven multidrug efflux pump